jgi:hypothetical protein
MESLIEAMRSVFLWMDGLESSVELRGSIYVSPYTTVAHVISMSMFAGTLVMMDLRLMGLGNMESSLSQLQRRLFPWQAAGVTVATITGGMLVFANPMNFFPNVIFWTKMASMAVAGVNALVFHVLTYPSVAQWDGPGVVPPPAARLAGTLGILLWTNVIVAGRLMYYAKLWFPTGWEN